MSESNYAHNQGTILLNKIFSAVGPIFTSPQAQEIMAETGIGANRVNALLSQLTQAGWLTRVKRGAYVIQSPLLRTEIHPYALASVLLAPAAISHWSALAYHGLTTQIPPMIQASTPRTVITPEMRSGKTYRPRGRAVWRSMGIEFEFIHIKPAHFFGFQKEWVSQWHRVNITDQERTIIDMIAHPQIFGSLRVGIETCHTYLDRLDVDKLIAYALRYEVGAVIKRLGWILENLGLAESRTEPLLTYPTSSYHLLDPTGDAGGMPIARWSLYNNIQTG
jgi:predicted transcriptional regulator of viral defense system